MAVPETDSSSSEGYFSYRTWLTANSYVIDIVGAFGLILAAVLWLLSLPSTLVALIAGISLGVIFVGVGATVSRNAGQSVQSLGSLQPSVSLPTLNPPKTGAKQEESLPTAFAGSEKLMTGEPKLAISDETLVAAPLTTQAPIGRTAFRVECEILGPLREVKISIEGESAQRPYVVYTDRGGMAQLNIPVGNYLVSFEADNHLPHTEGVAVRERYYGEQHLVRLQMEDGPRRAAITANVMSLVNGMAERHRKGHEILLRAHSAGPTPQLEHDVDAWERETEVFLIRWNHQQSKKFMADHPVLTYPIMFVTPDHQAFLNRIHTRLSRIEEMGDGLKRNLDDGMLF